MAKLGDFMIWNTVLIQARYNMRYGWTTNSIGSQNFPKIEWKSRKFQFSASMNSLMKQLISLYRRIIQRLSWFFAIFSALTIFICVCLSNSQSGKRDRTYELQWSWSQYVRHSKHTMWTIWDCLTAVKYGSQCHYQNRIFTFFFKLFRSPKI